MNRLPKPAPKVGRAYSLHLYRDTSVRADIVVTTPGRWKLLPESRPPLWVMVTFRCPIVTFVVATKLTIIEGACLDHAEGQHVTPSLN